VLVSAGNIKRDQIQQAYIEAHNQGQNIEAKDIANQISEQQILIQSICETLTPKLVSEGITLLQSLLKDVFPDTSYPPNHHTGYN
jgi:dynein heavy chain 1